MLAWTTSNASSVDISGVGTVSTSGSQAVTPADTTSYTITAKGTGGTTTASATISVYPRTVVFMGDSITVFWGQNLDFTSLGWTNVGISGQNTAQMLSRFQTDVIARHPDAVHILAGTNDYTIGWQSTTDNLNSMIQQAKAAGILVYIGTIPPWGAGRVADQCDIDYTDHNAHVAQVNQWIQAQTGVTVIDYHTLLTGPNGLFVPALTSDGVHPSQDGFTAMSTAAEGKLVLK
jgi:Lysophospholipase L1 and related esterases